MRALPSIVAFAAALMASHTLAQCPGVPVAIGVESGVCALRVNWTAPTPGQIASVFVRRGTTSNFSDSVLIGAVNPAIPFFTDNSPPADTQAVYWVVLVPTDPQCPALIAGPVAGRPYNQGSAYSRPTVTSDCNSIVTITSASVFDATSYQLGRRAPGEATFSDLGGPVPIPFFLDASASVGGPYEYAVYPRGSCGFAASSLVRTVDIAGSPTVIPGPARVAGFNQNVTLIFDVKTGPNSTQTLLRDGVVVVGARPVDSGVTGTSLFNLRWSDAGEYVLRVSSPCGTTDSAPIVVAVREKPCAADFNDSGTRDVSDIFAFLSVWFAGCP